MAKDKFDINITMTRDGRKFALIKSKRRDCRSCAFNRSPAGVALR